MTHRALIEAFYETIKDKYPNLTLDDVGRICCSPFHFANRAIIGDNLPVIRFKYLGIFSVKRNRAYLCMQKYTNYFKANKMSEKSYNREMAKLGKILNRPEEIVQKPQLDIEDDV